ncbi:MAG TPA: FHA domain-containing protein, partial [Polyangia bacterium]|nr:FHA domain-containing protein [Polyangia bacterium]
MRGNDTGTDTEPEAGRPTDSRGKRAVLLIASFDERVVAPLPASGALTIGRGRSASRAADGEAPGELSIALADGLLSRKHLRIAATARGHEIEDLESRNGTFLDGRRLEGPTRLSEGCIVLFGNQVAVFRLVTERELAALDQEAGAPFGPTPTFSPALALTFSRLRKLARTDAELL